MQGLISSVGNIDTGGQGGGLEAFVLFDISLPSPSGSETLENRTTTYYNISRNNVNVYMISPLGDQESMSLDDLLYYDLHPTSNNNYSAGMILSYDGSNFSCKVNVAPSMTSISRIKFLFLFTGLSEPLSVINIKNYVDLAMLSPQIQVSVPEVDTTRTFYCTTHNCTCSVYTEENSCSITVPATSIKLNKQGDSPRFITASEWTTLLNTSNFKISTSGLPSDWKYKINKILVTSTGVTIEGENFHEIGAGRYNVATGNEFTYTITFTRDATIFAFNPTTSKLVDIAPSYILSTEGLYVKSRMEHVYFDLLNSSSETLGRYSMIVPTPPVQLQNNGYFSKAPAYGNIYINGENKSILWWRISSGGANTLGISTTNGVETYNMANISSTYLYY